MYKNNEDLETSDPPTPAKTVASIQKSPHKTKSTIVPFSSFYSSQVLKKNYSSNALNTPKKDWPKYMIRSSSNFHNSSERPSSKQDFQKI